MATLLGLNNPVSNISFFPTKTTTTIRSPYYRVLCGRYEILEEVSRGSYGVVFKARDTKTGRIVAVKQEFHGSSIESTREINILDCLPRHPSIVEYCDCPVDDQRGVYIVMEYLETDLHRLMESRSRPAFTLSEVKRLMRQLLEGFELLHENGVMHRDLKPSNILVVDDQKRNNLQLKIGDFGLSRFFDLRKGTVQEDSQCVCSLWYRAPELLLGAREYSCAIDMWSVGCIMAELLLNEVLFRGRDESSQLAIVYDAVLGRDGLPSKFFHLAAPTNYPIQVTTPCLDLITDLLEPDPKQRITATQALHHPWFNEFPFAAA